MVSSSGSGGHDPPLPPRRRGRLFRIWSSSSLLLLSLAGACSFFYAYLSGGGGDLLLINNLNFLQLVKAVEKGQLIKSGNVSCRFRFPESWRPAQLLVDLPGKCQIPAIDSWREDMKPWARVLPKLNCSGSSSRPRISYIQDNKILLDLKLLLNYSAEAEVGASCCYKSIHRNSQSLGNYDKNADNSFYYSKACEPMSSVHPTIPNSLFVKVECTKVNNSSGGDGRGGQVLYQKFHAVALLPPPPRPVPNDTDEAKEINATSSRVGAIVDFWEECSKQRRPGNVSLCAGFRTSPHHHPPPNVLLLGIDSTSRLNFRRHMTRTVALLTRIGAVEMLGYTKVGVNTFPNLVPMFMSLSVEELRSTCERNPSNDSLDDCPLIWKDFSSLHYLTAHLEDCPRGQIFNYLQRTGFVLPPVDIYLRPFVKALYKKGLSKPHCDGYESVEELILNLAVDLMTTANGKNVPTFISTWLTDLTHDDPNGLQKLDDVFYSALRRLEQVGTLSNTILFLLGDHGYHHLPSRNTLSGYFEVNLPPLWIHLPETMRRSNADWMPNLLLNGRILATPYDMHATLHHILTSVNSKYNTDLSKNDTPEEWGRLKEKAKGKSLFRPLPHRNCEEAHIPKDFCSCAPPVQYDDTEMILIAANAAVGIINSRLPAGCRRLSVSVVFFSGLVRDPKKTTQSPSLSWTTRRTPSENEPQEGDGLVLGIDVNPGGMRFQVLVAFDKDSSAFTNVTATLRTSPQGVGPDCLKGNFLLKNPFFV